jgi:glutathione S-transferase
MDLYFSPLACSMATRIVLNEAGADATFIEVDPHTKTLLEDGSDYRRINPLGLVPALRTDHGEVLTENIAVLHHVASRVGNDLIPSDPAELTRLHQWLSFISSELHTRLFSGLFDPNAPEAVRSRGLEKSAVRLARLDEHLADRDYLVGDDFTIADAYLITVLNWIQATPIDLTPWPAVRAYLERGRERPSVKGAIAVELPLYREERARSA